MTRVGRGTLRWSTLMGKIIALFFWPLQALPKINLLQILTLFHVSEENFQGGLTAAASDYFQFF